jgi:hypothetical protein
MVVLQELSDRDMANRITVAKSLIRILSDDVIILMADEAHFHSTVCVKRQNYRYWAEENPQQLHRQPHHSGCVTVWCGVANFGIIGPYFFADEDGSAVTVTSARYVEILPELPHTRSESSWN